MIDLSLLSRFFTANPRFRTSLGCGIVMATDGNLFPGLQMLLLSINGQAPIAVFDLGLNSAQITWCGSIPGVQVLSPPIFAVPKSIPMWLAWNKPFYLQASPFDLSLWIDADAFVVGVLEPLFQAAANGFWVVKHQLRYPQPNDDRLYEQRPVKRRFPPNFHFNCGVVGFFKGDPLLETWANAVRDFATKPELRAWASHYDEAPCTGRLKPSTAMKR